MIYQTLTMPRTGVPVTLYLQDNSSVEPERRRPLVLLCPGGGYRTRVPREGEPVALKLLSCGVQAAIVHYSVAPAVWPQALNEVGEAMAYARAHAEEWLCDAKRIAVMGFSAGGHAAAALGVFWHTLPWGQGCRPDAMILGYPVISGGEHRHDNSFRRLLGEAYGEEGLERVSLEKHVRQDTSPAFLWHTWDDAVVPVENSLLFAAALRRAGVGCEMHIYQKGEHGMALCNEETHQNKPSRVMPTHQGWIDLAARWLKEL